MGKSKSEDKRVITMYRKVKMQNKGVVSIIVPCYNHEKFLDDCLLGILEQDYKDIEVLICDDCSPDASFQLIKTYEERLKDRFFRVEILKNEVNCGVTKNINRMLAMANGEYIKIIASDDVLVPNAISRMVMCMEAHPSTGIVISNGVRISEEEHHGAYGQGERIYTLPLDLTADDILNKTYAHNDIFAPGAFIRKSVFDEVGFYDEEIAIEDLEFWLRVMTKSKVQFVFLDEDLILYRVNSDSMTSMSANQRLEGRRIRFHQAEVAILKKYKDAVPKALYANTLWERIMAEKGLAIHFRLKELETLANTEMKEFDGWKYLSLNTKVKYRLKNTKWFLKKVYYCFKR